MSRCSLCRWLVANGYQQYLLDLIMINVVLAVGLNIVKGFAGQVNVGHVALAAIGAYTSAVLSTKFGLPFWFALPLATLATGLCRRDGRRAVVPPRGRLSRIGDSWASPNPCGSSSPSLTIWVPRSGMGDIPPPIIAGWRLILAMRPTTTWIMPIAVIGTYIAFSILHSDVGRAFNAIREDTLAAAASGIDVRKYKLLAFVISALYAGCAGSLAAHMAPGFIHPDDYNLTRMVTVILMVVAGGLGHVWGGVIGAALITLIAEWTRSYYQYEFIIFGLIVVLTMMYMPRGIGGYIDRRIATRRFIALRGGQGPPPRLA